MPHSIKNQFEKVKENRMNDVETDRKLTTMKIYHRKDWIRHGRRKVCLITMKTWSLSVNHSDK